MKAAVALALTAAGLTSGLLVWFSALPAAQAGHLDGLSLLFASWSTVVGVSFLLYAVGASIRDAVRRVAGVR